jgi:hypothetical protein
VLEQAQYHVVYGVAEMLASRSHTRNRRFVWTWIRAVTPATSPPTTPVLDIPSLKNGNAQQYVTDGDNTPHRRCRIQNLSQVADVDRYGWLASKRWHVANYYTGRQKP